MYTAPIRSLVTAFAVLSPLAVGYASMASGAEVAPKAAQAAPVDAGQLLKDSDRARGAVGEGISWEIDVQTFEDGTTNQVHYQVKVKGVDALAEALQPARNKGETMLFNDRNLWFFKPGLKKPVAISARQKLMGQAANGDIASTNYNRDYDGKISGEETVNGEACYKLDLKAKAKNVTYDGIRYWITKKDHLGWKAEFLTVSGEMFKSALFKYGNKLKIDGKELPFVSQMDINDALKPGSHTLIQYSQPHAEAHPESLFNINNLVR